MGSWKKWTDRLLTLAFSICVLAVVWVLVQVISFTSFRVPSPSMYPTLIPGDYILVNKADGSENLRHRGCSHEGMEVGLSAGWRGALE